MSPKALEPSLEFRDIRCSHSESLPALLSQLRLSILISTYQTGHLVVVAARRGAADSDVSSIRSGHGHCDQAGNDRHLHAQGSLVRARRSRHRRQTRTQRDNMTHAFWRGTAHFTDDIEAHESAWVGNEFWVVNTLFSCLAALHPSYSFAPRWRPPFISALRPEDRCHLNGLALVDGQPRYVTALAETDSPAGWREVKATGGCVIDVASGQTVVRGLALPHSPRVVGKQLYFLHSGHGRLECLNPSTGKIDSRGPIAWHCDEVWRFTPDSRSSASPRPGRL